MKVSVYTNGLNWSEEKIKKTAAKAPKAESKKAKEENKETAKIAELSDKLSREHDDYLRLMAEFETFRRRNAEERLALVNSASADTIKGMLPVLDDCERAIQLLATSSDEAAREGT